MTKGKLPERGRLWKERPMSFSCPRSHDAQSLIFPAFLSTDDGLTTCRSDGAARHSVPARSGLVNSSPDITAHTGLCRSRTCPVMSRTQDCRLRQNARRIQDGELRIGGADQELP